MPHGCVLYKHVVTMSPKELTAFRMDRDLLKAMRHIRNTDGVPLSVQVDFALRDWLKRRGVVIQKKAARKRTVSTTRKRA